MKAKNRNKVKRASRVAKAQSRVAALINMLIRVDGQAQPKVLTHATELQRAGQRGRSRSHSKRVRRASS